MAPETGKMSIQLRKPGEIVAYRDDMLKALRTADRQIRLARAEILSLNQRLKALERRVHNVEQWKGEQK